MQCKFGCGLPVVEAGRCDKSANRCPVVRSRNASGMKANWAAGRKSNYQSFPQDVKDRMAWSRGKTKDNNSSVKKVSDSLRGRARLSDPERGKKLSYWRSCQFDLKGVIQNVLGYDLLVKLGMYHKTKNRGGVVRDHRLSIDKGFLLGVSADLVAHPANCRFVTCLDNSRKSKASELTPQELRDEIDAWNLRMSEIKE